MFNIFLSIYFGPQIVHLRRYKNWALTTNMILLPKNVCVA